MNDITFLEAVTALKNEWELSLPESVSEEDLLQRLADKIVRVIEQGPEAFFQLMYRLDIPEKKLNASLHEADIAKRVAQLVFERQLQKIQSRQQNKVKREEDDPELRW